MLNEIQQQSFERLFATFDKNSNGSIDEADFMQAFEGIKAASDPAKAEKIDKTARRWFLSLYVFADSDRSRKVSKEEWMNWAAGIAEEAQQPGEMPRKYGHFVDAVFAGITNDDQTITAAEYATWFHSFGLTGDPAAIFQRMDADGDGQISKKEFDQRIKEFVGGDTASAGYQLFG